MQKHPVRWNVFCDFDGTISTVDATFSLLKAFALPEWLKIEEDWKQGQIGSMDCMRLQVELLRCDRLTLENHLSAIDIDPYFPEFVRYCSDHKIPLVVVSDGIDEVIRLILKRFKLEHLPIYTNRLVELGKDRYSLSFPNAQIGCRKACGTCKRSLMKIHHAKNSLNLLIGDGMSDFCAAEGADFVLAKDKLLTRCRKRNISHSPFGNFKDVLDFFNQDMLIKTHSPAPIGAKLSDQHG